VKIVFGGEEKKVSKYKIQTPKLTEETGGMDEAQTLQATRELYCQTRDAIDAEIKHRRESWRDGSPDSRGPTPGFR
jgi:hypothetical protein